MSKRKVLLLGAATMAAGAAWLGIRNCSIAPATISAAAQLGANEKSPVALVAKNVLVPLTLVERTKLTHDTENFRFSLPDPEQALGLPTGQHVHLQTEINGKWLVRLYTPVSSDEDKGITDIVAKLYRPNEAFPEGGKMSKVLDALKPGDVIHARGPTGNFFYRNNGNVALKKWKKEPEPTIFHKVDKIVMIAGGSGITPMLQLIKHVLKDPTDDTKLELLFANKSEEDIMLRDQLESLSSKHPQQFKVWYTLDKAPPGWKYSEGFINADIVKKNLSPPAQDTFVLLCGPKPMIERACLPTLESLGYSKDRIHKF